MELQWPLILFTLFIAWSAGLFATQGATALEHGSKSSAHVQKQSLVVSFALLVIGGIAVFFHLQHWERIFNGFGHITSGITQELIFIVVMFLVMVAFFIVLRKNTEEEASIPTWLSVLAIVTAALLVCVMGHSYMMASRPGWNSVLEVASLLGSACVLGPATYLAIARGNATDADTKTLVAGAIINLVCIIAYVAALSVIGGSFNSVGNYFDPTHPLNPMVDISSINPFSAGNMPMTLIALLVGGAAPLALGFALKKKPGNLALILLVIVCAVVGTVCLRVLFYQMGFTEFLIY